MGRDCHLGLNVCTVRLLPVPIAHSLQAEGYKAKDNNNETETKKEIRLKCVIYQM